MVRTITLRGIVSSQSGKLITLVALPTQSTTTVASICTHGQQNIRQMLSGFSNVVCLRKLVHGEECCRSYLSDSDTYWWREPTWEKSQSVSRNPTRGSQWNRKVWLYKTRLLTAVPNQKLSLLVGHRRVGSAILPTELPGATLAAVASQVIHRFRRSGNPTCSWWGRFCWSRRSGRSSHRKTQRQTASQTLSKVCPPSPTSSHSSPSVGSSSAISSPQLTHRYTRPRARNTCTWCNFRPSQSLHRYRINFDVGVNRSDKCHSDRYIYVCFMANVIFFFKHPFLTSIPSGSE